jgi:large subunit ribosomal protein L18
MSQIKDDQRLRRKASIRKKVSGTQERPRLSVFRSSKHIYAQVIDDLAQRTLVAASTLDPALEAELQGLKKSDKARKVGAAIAAKCKTAGIDKVVFDRNGYIYHGRVEALANAAREAGLNF